MNKKLKVYNAGGLFSESQIAQRLKDANKLREMGYEVFNPIEAPQNNKDELPTSENIFDGDYKEVCDADIIFADLSDMDIGVAVELAIGFEKKKPMVVYISDIRKETAHKYQGNRVPWGMNTFLLGMLHRGEAKVFNSSEEAYDFMNIVIKGELE